MNNTSRPALAALLICILIIVKLKFLINVDGFELVTFTLVMYGIYFRFKFNLLIIFSFNFLVAIIYGFGIWWLAYWYIWPIELIITSLLGRWLLKSHILTAFYTGFWGFSIWIFYFPLHIIIFGWTVAVAFIPAGIVVNSIEGLFNFCVCMALAVPVKRMFVAVYNNYAFQFKSLWSFAIINYCKI